MKKNNKPILIHKKGFSDKNLSKKYIHWNQIQIELYSYVSFRVTYSHEKPTPRIVMNKK